MEDFERESLLLKEVKHPNIVLRLGVAKNPETGVFCIVTEFMEGSSLESWLYKDETKKAKLSPAVKFRTIFQIAKGIKTRLLHSRVLGLNYLQSRHHSSGFETGEHSSVGQ